MDPLHFCIAVTPIAVYLLLIGAINLFGRPFVTTGARDAAALGVAISGLIIIGPMELFFPERAAIQWGGYVWILLVVFYGLCISLAVLLMRPRIIVYNMNRDRFRPILVDVANKLDNGSRWTGESLQMPTMNVHLHLEGSSWTKNTSLVASGDRQSYEGWRKLESELRASLRKTQVPRNILGIVLIGVAAVMAIGTAAWMLGQKQIVAQSLREMLRL